MNRRRRKGTTRATRGKLEKALDLIDDFVNGTDYEKTLPDVADRQKLERARTAIADIEADLWRQRYS